MRVLMTLAFALCACGVSNECKPSTGDICSASGTGIAGFSGDGKAAFTAELYLPIDVTVHDATAYVVDWNNHRIRGIDSAGIIKTVAGSGKLGDGPDGLAEQADFNHPTSVAFDPDGRLVIAAWHNSRLKRLDLQTGELTNSCGTGKRAYTGDNGPALMADLDLPAGVAFDSKGNAFVMDQANQVIRKIDPAGIISRYAGQCVIACVEPLVPAACAGTNKTYCKVDPDGCKKPCEGGFAGDDGPALSARMNQPYGQAADPAGRLAIDADDNLYFADTKNHRVRKITAEGIITTVAGNGTAGKDGDGGKATEGQLDTPADVAISRDGTLYIADTQNSCIRAVTSDGTLHTVAGVCGQSGFRGDHATATSALLNRPYGIDVDGDGLLYIADTYNHRLRIVRLAAASRQAQ